MKNYLIPVAVLSVIGAIGFAYYIGKQSGDTHVTDITLAQIMKKVTIKAEDERVLATWFKGCKTGTFLGAANAKFMVVSMGKLRFSTNLANASFSEPSADNVVTVTLPPISVGSVEFGVNPEILIDGKWFTKDNDITRGVSKTLEAMGTYLGIATLINDYNNVYGGLTEIATDHYNNAIVDHVASNGEQIRPIYKIEWAEKPTAKQLQAQLTKLKGLKKPPFGIPGCKEDSGLRVNGNKIVNLHSGKRKGATLDQEPEISPEMAELAEFAADVAFARRLEEAGAVESLEEYMRVEKRFQGPATTFQLDPSSDAYYDLMRQLRNNDKIRARFGAGQALSKEQWDGLLGSLPTVQYQPDNEQD